MLSPVNGTSKTEIVTQETNQIDPNAELWNILRNHELSSEKKIALMSVAIEQGANVNAPEVPSDAKRKYSSNSKAGKLLLHSALEDVELTLFLLNSGADPFKKDQHGQHACFHTMNPELWHVFCTHAGKTLQELLTHRSNKHSFLYHVYLEALPRKQMELFDLLLSHRGELKNVFYGGLTILHELMEHENGTTFAKKCIEIGFVDVEAALPSPYGPTTALYRAFVHSNPTGAQMLIEQGALLDKSSLGYVLSLYDDTSLVSTILAKHPFPCHGWSKIHFAARCGAHEELKALLKTDFSLAHSVIFDHSTPLHLSTQEGQFLSAFLLLEAGSNPFAKDKKELMPGQDDPRVPQRPAMVEFLGIYRNYLDAAERSNQLQTCLNKHLEKYEAIYQDKRSTMECVHRYARLIKEFKTIQTLLTKT